MVSYFHHCFHCAFVKTKNPEGKSVWSLPLRFAIGIDRTLFLIVSSFTPHVLQPSRSISVHFFFFGPLLVPISDCSYVFTKAVPERFGARGKVKNIQPLLIYSLIVLL